MNEREFEERLALCRGALNRLVHVKISSYADAEDVVQESCIAAFRARDSLRDAEAFRGWLLQIGRNRIRDYYRARGRTRETALETVDRGAYGVHEARHDVSDAMDELREDDRRVLSMYYMDELTQDEVARRLGVPVGTVKSRLHSARNRFRRVYETKEAMEIMKKLPEVMPEYSIKWKEDAPFPVKWEEVMGWFIVPRQGEKLSWAMYDFPEKKRTELVDMRVVGKAAVHGEEGVEVEAVETYEGGVKRNFVCQLTDSHCRILSETHMDGDVKRTFTFLDGDDFIKNWGFGEDNCGNETDIAPKGDIVRRGNEITGGKPGGVLDVVGRAEVAIAGRVFDTVCVMDIECYEGFVMTEQFIDKNGRTVLWRRFNADAWKAEKYGGLWSERMPENERLYANGETFVHWYDCITDYIMK